MAEACSPAHKTLNEYIKRGENLIARCLSRTDIHGTPQLARKIQAEVKFLKRSHRKDEHALEMHLKSTNLTHLEAIVTRMETLPHVTHVLKRFQPISGEPVLVDIICNHGYTWVKVIARKAEALHRIWAGGGQFGDKSIVDQASVYKQCTQRYTKNFSPPQLLFIFCQGVSTAMKNALTADEILVDGDVCDIDTIYNIEPVAPSMNEMGDNKETHFPPNADDNSAFWPLAHDGEEGDSDSSEELLSATELLQRQKGQHDLFSYIAQKERKYIKESENTECTHSDSEVEVNRRDENTSSNKSINFEIANNFESQQRPKVRNTPSNRGSSSDREDNESECTLHQSTCFKSRNHDVRDSASAECDRNGPNVINPGIAQHIHALSIKDKSDDTLQKLNDPSLSQGGNRERNDSVTVKLNAIDHVHDRRSHPGDFSEGGGKSKMDSLSKSDCDTNSYDNGRSESSLPSACDVSVPFIAQPQIRKLNLDITTLISYISNLCHGHCDYVFKEPILSSQAAQERRSPLLPVLDRCFEGKDLYICETALVDFRTIVNTVGGASECARADKLLARINVIPDDVSTRVLALPISAKVKERAKVIFGTGEQIQAVTVTANAGFVRAAEHRGVNIPVILHESRALSEQKQARASPI